MVLIASWLDENKCVIEVNLGQQSINCLIFCGSYKIKDLKKYNITGVEFYKNELLRTADSVIVDGYIFH